MGRIIVCTALTLAVCAAVARAEPEDDPAAPAKFATRLEAFDKAAGTEWEAAFPAPFYRKAPADGPEQMNLTLKPGSYMVVVLCQCAQMDVSLISPSGAKVEPLRKSDQAAMYSLDVASAGDYLTGVDMGECGSGQCDLAIKVYRKK